MESNFEKLLSLVLKHEGGYVNHPKDPGGATNKGVTQATYDRYRAFIGQPKRSVRSITGVEVKDIYKRHYWDPVGGNKLPKGLDYCVFDFAVNSGVSRAAKMLQRVVGADVDGQVGLQTIAKANAAPVIQAITEICNKRHAWMKTLKTYATFGKGWRRRVMGDTDGFQKNDFGVIDYAINMALEAQGQAVVKTKDMPTPAAIGSREGEVAAGKALEGDKLVVRSKMGVGSVVAGAGAVAPVVMQATDVIQPHVGKDGMIGNLALVAFSLLVLIGVGLTLYGLKAKINGRPAQSADAAESAGSSLGSGLIDLLREIAQIGPSGVAIVVLVLIIALFGWIIVQQTKTILSIRE